MRGSTSPAGEGGTTVAGAVGAGRSCGAAYPRAWMAAALLPQLRMRPGSRSGDLDGLRRHLSHIMTEREQLAGNIVRRHTCLDPDQARRCIC
jgi:hypothetical protein